MKKLLIILTLLSIPAFLYAQMEDIDTFFKDYSGVKGYKTVCFGQKILELYVGEDNPVINDIDMIRILRSEKNDPEMTDRIKLIAESCYELVSVTDDSGNITSFHLSVPEKEKDKEKEKANGKKSFLMIAIRKGEDIVMEIRGDYSVKDIALLPKLAQ